MEPALPGILCQKSFARAGSVCADPALAEPIHPVISFCFDSRGIHARNGSPIVYHAAFSSMGMR
jgi:hypothetical protein